MGGLKGLMLVVFGICVGLVLGFVEKSIKLAEVGGVRKVAYDDGADGKRLAFDSLFFVKFHKVGGTTAAIALVNLGRRLGYSSSCRFGGKMSMCMEHDSMKVLRNVRAGELPLDRLYVKFPIPLKMMLDRHPYEKIISAAFWMITKDGGHNSTHDEIRKVLPFAWNYVNEGVKTLGTYRNGTQSLQLALQTMEMFQVVGVTEDMPGFFAQAGAYLHLPASEMVYRSAKVVNGRPSFEELPNSIRYQIMEYVESDANNEITFYVHAKQLSLRRVEDLGIHEEVQFLRSEEERMNKELGCDDSGHDRAGGLFVGKWCYNYKD